jgi:hypothetical protein
MDLLNGLPHFFNSDINCFKKTIYPNRAVYTQEGNPWKVVVTKDTLTILDDFNVVFLKVDMDPTYKWAEELAATEAYAILVKDLIYNKTPMPRYENELKDILWRENSITMLEFRFDNPFYKGNR